MGKTQIYQKGNFRKQVILYVICYITLMGRVSHFLSYDILARLLGECSNSASTKRCSESSGQRDDV